MTRPSHGAAEPAPHLPDEIRGPVVAVSVSMHRIAETGQPP